ncbi:MAG TPA: hypothetical protein VNW71_25300 [Thermoanaerobaculia bacterium]|nr:hypothetical protein [Thermoanaerobaculia bacterium]
MAEGTGRVTEVDEEAPGDPRPIEADIVRQRAQLTTLVTELQRRGHELTDVGLQVRRHAVAVTATVLAVGAVAVGSIALGVWRARRRNTLTARGGRLREAVGRMIDRPERVAVEATVTQRIIGAAGSAAAAFLIKAILERVSRPPRHPGASARHVSPAPGKGLPGNF